MEGTNAVLLALLVIIVIGAMYVQQQRAQELAKDAEQDAALKAAQSELTRLAIEKTKAPPAQPVVVAVPTPGLGYWPRYGPRYGLGYSYGPAYGDWSGGALPYYGPGGARRYMPPGYAEFGPYSRRRWSPWSWHRSAAMTASR